MTDETEHRAPFEGVPQDGFWYPAEDPPGVWRGHRKWVEENEPGQHPCACAEGDSKGDRAVTFATEAECQQRCNQLNRTLVQ